MMASASENRPLVWALTVGHGSTIGDGDFGGGGGTETYGEDLEGCFWRAYWASSV